MNATTRPEQTALQRHDTEDCNTSQNPSISDIIDARLSRRSLFKAGFGTAGSAVLGTVALSACGGGDSAAVAAPVDTGIKLAFPAVPKSTADARGAPFADLGRPLIFGVLVVLNMMIGLIHPPFGMLLFVTKALTGIPIGAMMREGWMFIVMLVGLLLAITVFPQIVLWLPQQMGYGAK